MLWCFSLVIAGWILYFSLPKTTREDNLHFDKPLMFIWMQWTLNLSVRHPSIREQHITYCSLPFRLHIITFIKTILDDYKKGENYNNNYIENADMTVSISLIVKKWLISYKLIESFYAWEITFLRVHTRISSLATFSHPWIVICFLPIVRYFPKAFLRSIL